MSWSIREVNDLIYIGDENQEIELITEMLIETRRIVLQWWTITGFRPKGGEIFCDGQDKHVVVVYLRVSKDEILILPVGSLFFRCLILPRLPATPARSP